MAKTKKKYQGYKPKKKNKTDLGKLVTSFFNRNKDSTFRTKDVQDALGLTSEAERLLVQNLLSELVEDDFIIEVSPKKYKTNTKGVFIDGIFERRSNGKNALIPDDGSKPIRVAERNSSRAMNGDKVRVLLYAKKRGKDPEGEVVEILERAETKFVGVMEVGKNYSFLVSDSKFLANDIFIPKDLLNGAEDGDKVVVKIIEWPEKAKNPIGRVIDVLGKPGDNNTEMHAILAEFGLPYSYPEELEKLANAIPEDITDEEIAKREDFRKITTFTIDPVTAKDFDDALSIRKLRNGNWEVGVHIADVTHYVKENDPIDQEAQKRATSVYLVDRTIPMLPEKLSNFLCSLRPNEDKLSYSCIFELDEQANIINHRIGRTIIHSDRRFTYQEAQDMIDGGEGDFKNEILTLDGLAKKIRSKRFTNGALSFDKPEIGFVIDENGKPISTFFKYQNDANQLIEEFMLLANKTVATQSQSFMEKKNPKTFPFRVHDVPNEDKLDNLSKFIKTFGYKLSIEGSNYQVARSLNRLLENVHGKPEENLITTIAVRAMAKAVYTTHNIGHYGLAFDFYTHFTSPIRRYPDMMVHRLFTDYVAKKPSGNVEKYEELCKHSSDMEQLAANAERASIKYKQVEFMKDKVGMDFDATISGIAEWGIYAEIVENKCEGLIPIRDLVGDYYEFDEKNYCLRGKRSGKIYRLGDKLKIRVAKANLERKQLDFALVK